ncbi:MAG: MmgE/PrpD family protein [Acidimicrobiaceae bacterium]|nr:MmgE/PrpD family protein [Acidimicrobiaceae bacterium]MBT5851924.1 MmgE/PrpD family protein [Acidimicrobiaceae bacterium]
MLLPSELQSFIHGTTLDDLPDDVVAMGRRCLLDLIGVAASGSRTDLSRLIRGHAVDHFAAGGAGAPLLLDGRIVSPAGAALAGGMTIDSLDAHDGHRLTKGHAGCGLLPALMAYTSAEGVADGGEFLATLIVGYEVATRAGIVLHETVPDYHTSGAWIAVACAAIGARVLGLDPAVTAEAVGIAEYHGPRSQMMRVIDHPTMLKDGSGWGAMAGVSAAYLARDGFTGAPAITMTAPEVHDRWADLGSTWWILDQYFKPHPVCRWAQPAVQATLQLRAANGFDGADVAGIVVETFHEGARLTTRHPKSTEQAQYSLPFPVAVALHAGRLGPGELGPTMLADPAVAKLADLVEICENDDHNAAFPGKRWARVSIDLTDGRRLESPDTEASGDPHLALTDQQVRAKFHDYADPVLGAERAASIESVVDALEAGSYINEFLELVLSAP